MLRAICFQSASAWRPWASLLCSVAVTNCFLAATAVRQSIEKKKDTTTVWVPPPKVPFGGPANVQYSKTTYHDYELEKIKGMIQQSLIVCVLMSFMSFKFGIHLPLVRHAHFHAPVSIPVQHLFDVRRRLCA